MKYQVQFRAKGRILGLGVVWRNVDPEFATQYQAEQWIIEHKDEDFEYRVVLAEPQKKRYYIVEGADGLLYAYRSMEELASQMDAEFESCDVLCVCEVVETKQPKITTTVEWE